MTTELDVMNSIYGAQKLEDVARSLFRELTESRDALADSEERRVAAETARDLLADENADLRKEARR